MEIFEIFEKRHSYRGPFLDMPVMKVHLRKIVEAGILAPSGCNKQTTEFVIINDAKILDEIHKMHPKSKAIQQARAVICCIIDKNPEAAYEGFSFQVEDCAAAVQNMLLAITSFGYASVWVDGWLRRNNNADTIGQLIGIPDSKIIRVILPIGIPEEQHKQPEKKPFHERAWFNKYGNEEN